MIYRQLTDKLTKLAKTFPIVAILGPRQSGKTTLAKATFPHHTYVSLEDFDRREFAINDPRGFLETYANEGVVIDEVQHAPQLFSYIQTFVDEKKKPGSIILTGSQNFLLNEKISQTLAGRIAITTLLPLTIGELKAAKKLPEDLDEVLFRGFYPRVDISSKMDPHDWYSNYLRTYVERDIRQMKNIENLDTFQKFLKLAAGRIGQLLNLTSLAADTGISVNTAKGWISLLQASYILFTLQPYYKNFGKRVVKTPKLYFYDPAIACSLLGIESEKQLSTHYLKGNIFESMVISDLMKQRYNQGLNPNLYFWRDQAGHEVDAILEGKQGLFAIEVKSGQTVGSDAFDGLKKWQELTQEKQAALIYGGKEDQKRTIAQVLSWHNLDLFTKN